MTAGRAAVLPKALILGGGAMGLSTAWGFLRHGWRVELVEQAAIPNELGSSVDEARLIRATYGSEIGYAAMVAEAYEAWDLLWAEIGRPLYHQTGVLARLGDQEDGWGRTSLATIRALGLPHRIRTGRDLAASWPHLRFDPDEEWLHQQEGGVLYARRIVAGLADILRAGGAVLRQHSRAVAVDPDRASITLADGEVLTGDRLIVAAGPWTSKLLQDLAGHATPSLQMSLPILPPAGLDSAWAATPVMLDIENGLYLAPPTPESALKAGDHRFSLAGDPDGARLAAPEIVAAICEIVLARVSHPEAYRFGEPRLCFYTVDPQERFRLIPTGDRGWAMTGFSGHGFKFAACLGLRLSQAIAEEREPAMLTAWGAGLGAIGEQIGDRIGP